MLTLSSNHAVRISLLDEISVYGMAQSFFRPPPDFMSNVSQDVHTLQMMQDALPGSVAGL